MLAQDRQLILILVAFHPGKNEVDRLLNCLNFLPDSIGYAVVVNNYIHGEPVDALLPKADFVVCNQDNLGYGRAVNQVLRGLPDLPPFIGVLNTDLTWKINTFSILLDWIKDHQDVVLAVPKILSPSGTPVRLCKRNPTLLALLSRRFLPDWCKPTWLRRYDAWFVMSDYSLDRVVDVEYLSGCCMLFRSGPLLKVGGFDEEYFLYLEDADISRTMSAYGRCVHLPVASVTHKWGRGSYWNFRLMLVNFHSAWIYFSKWGFRFW